MSASRSSVPADLAVPAESAEELESACACGLAWANNCGLKLNVKMPITAQHTTTVANRCSRPCMVFIPSIECAYQLPQRRCCARLECGLARQCTYGPTKG